jgi:hypothetical protein
VVTVVKAKKKKNADGRKKNSDEATVSEAPKMMYAIKKPGTLTSNAISAEESKKQTAPTMTTNSKKTSREHHKMNNNVGYINQDCGTNRQRLSVRVRVTTTT